jgi:hypothetical protein
MDALAFLPKHGAIRSITSTAQKTHLFQVPKEMVPVDDTSSSIDIWVDLAKNFYPSDFSNDVTKTRDFAQSVTLLRVGVPSLFLAASATIAYPTVAMELANQINDSGVFAVVAQDASQYIQNILTTSGLMFSILVGQTYYFMYVVLRVTEGGCQTE